MGITVVLNIMGDGEESNKYLNVVMVAEADTAGEK